MKAVLITKEGGRREFNPGSFSLEQLTEVMLAGERLIWTDGKEYGPACLICLI